MDSFENSQAFSIINDEMIGLDFEFPSCMIIKGFELEHPDVQVGFFVKAVEDKNADKDNGSDAEDNDIEDSDDESEGIQYLVSMFVHEGNGKELSENEASILKIKEGVNHVLNEIDKNKLIVTKVQVFNENTHKEDNVRYDRTLKKQGAVEKENINEQENIHDNTIEEDV